MVWGRGYVVMKQRLGSWVMKEVGEEEWQLLGSFFIYCGGKLGPLK